MYRTFAALAALAVSATATGQDAPAPAAKTTPTTAEINARITAPLPADQAAMKAHVMFLASDAMHGREAGSAEYDIAAEYVAAQFYAAGLKPGGDEGGFLQKVPLVSYKAAGQGSAVWTPAGGQPRTLVFGEDYIPVANPARAETSVSAPVVFVGYGLDAPTLGLNDYRGVDVRGKVVAFMPGAPASLGGEERAFLGSPAAKQKFAAAHGAVGAIMIGGGRRGSVKTMAQGYDRARMTWARPDGSGFVDDAGTPLLAILSPEGAARLFGKGWARIATEFEKSTPRFRAASAPGTLTVATQTTMTPATSSNVIGMIPGSDPQVGKEVVVLSSHLDHIGMARTGEGDTIYNGALDDAIGIASLIEEAKRFKTSGTPPRRTILFMAVTAEEKGLVGSDYFANHPTVPKANIVADVNLDMPMLLYTFEDMVVYGAERSTLGPIVRRAVESAGVVLSPDPLPEQAIFVRSDHFRFVQQGIPAVFLWPGAKGPGKAAIDDFMAHRYHQPGDDLTQPILWDQGVRFVDVNYRIAREIADGPQRPVWNKGDYFGTLYKGPMAAK
ncbi:M28 family metallopeptidase [Sphingomonas sp. Leaf343]|uniref:M28 family metallopeptidase n=1 Tax=Sphingomonas sp. Leaf343 TaxID=1736345 RepID=UPI0007007748|nr:M28 family metallopeptidase [Sphingomonas sp. Leaf343]KQR80392.1 aminopeptidase [Sphingomonas sp. Leaf343]